MRNLSRMSKRKHILFLIMFCICTAFAGCTQKKREMPETVRAMWFAYPDYREILAGRDQKGYEAMADKIMEDLDSIGINTLYIHVCAYTDAYFPSKIYPMSKDVQDADYDPFGILVQKAKEHGIRTEAWINPLRSVLEEEAEDWEDGFILKEWVKENNERVRWVNGRYYLNPAYPEVRELIVSFVQEVLDTYDVDGIHFDDYFYPDGTSRNFDEYIYGEANAAEAISREDYRRAQINELVREVRDTVKKKGSDLTFGISVSGNNDYNRDQIFADTDAWIEEGLIDYLAPQIYWGFNNPSRPYARTVNEWRTFVGDRNCDLIIGLAAYKVGANDGYAGDAASEWIDSHDILARQLAYALGSECKGYAMFRYGSLFAPAEEVQEAAEEELKYLRI